MAQDDQSALGCNSSDGYFVERGKDDSGRGKTNPSSSYVEALKGECPPAITKDAYETLQRVNRELAEANKTLCFQSMLLDHIQDTIIATDLEGRITYANEAIAHDFNNLLVGILGNADLALRELPEKTSARVCIERVRDCALREAELTRQMLTYAGQARFRIQPVNLSELVADIGQLLWTSVSRKVKLQYSLAQDLPPISADASQLQQVLVILVLNASEAIGNNAGRIDIRTSLENIRQEELTHMFLGARLAGEHYVVLEVSDTGGGLDEETRPRIFEPFYSTKFPGRGLGLSAVLGVVRTHNGAIDVQNDPAEKGTTFRILLPACEAPTSTPPREQEDTNPSRKGERTLLIVDDEPPILRVAEAMLSQLGFQAILADNGQEAVKLFQERCEEIHAVLLDMSMPRMNGQATLMALREIRPNVPAILCTGYSEDEAAERFSDIKLAGFLQKPYELQAMAHVLQNVLSPT